MRINYKNLFLSITTISLLSIPDLAQTVIPQSTDQKQEERRFKSEELKNRALDEQKYNERIGKLPLERSHLRPLPGTKISYNKQFERTANLLVPPADYYEKYKAYLKSGKHELARLQPEMNCTKNCVLSAQDAERCADTVPV